MRSTGSSAVFVLAVLASIVLVNVLGVRLFGRVDLTRDRVFTLSQASKDTFARLEDPVTVTAYFTDKLPEPYSTNANFVRDLLEEYRAASKGKLAYQFIDPASQETEEDKQAKKDVKQDIFGRQFREPTSQEKELASAGIQPVQIEVREDDQRQIKRGYMGIVLRYQEKKEVIPVVQDVASLEYDLTSLVRKMTRPKTPVIGILQGHDEPKLEEKLRGLRTLLSQTYEVRPLSLGDKDRVDPDVDALMVFGPRTELKPNELKAIDQHVMSGKSAAFFLDSVHMDVRTFQPAEANHGLTGLLNGWGVTVGNQLVADVQSATLNMQEQRGFMIVNMPVNYPFIPILQRLEGDSPLTKGLSAVTFPFTTEVKAAPAAGRQVAVLARSSKKSWLEPRPYNVSPQREWRDVQLSGPHDLMVQVSGKLTSHFAAEAKVQQAQSTPAAPALLAESQGESRVIVAGGSSLFWDDFLQRPNQALLLNVADWLLLDPAMLAMRTRGLTLTPLQPELSAGTRGLAKFGNAFGLPVALALVGVVRWQLRERRRRAVTL